MMGHIYYYKFFFNMLLDQSDGPKQLSDLCISSYPLYIKVILSTKL